MADTLKATVRCVVQDVRLTATGFDRLMRVEYMVGTDGPFSFTIPEAQFTAAKVQEELNKRAAELSKLPR